MSITGTNTDKNSNSMAVNAKLIDAIKAFQFTPDPFKTQTPADHTSKSSHIKQENDTDTDGVYCKAEPGSDEWRQYQAGRLKSINVLKQSKKQPVLDDATSSHRQTILKRREGHNKSRSHSASSRESVRWKEPLDDNVELLAKVEKSGRVAATKKSSHVSKRSVNTQTRATQDKKSRRSPSKAKSVGKRSKSKLEVRARKSLPPVVSTSKCELNLVSNMPSIVVAPSQSKPPSVIASKSSARSNTSGKSQSLFGSISRTTTLSKLNRPKFPDVGVCKAYPGTLEWDDYWVNYNGQLAKYNLQMEEYRKSFKGISQEFGGFAEHLSENTLANDVFRMKMGMTPGVNKPPLVRHPITEPMTLFEGFTFRRVRDTKNTEEITSSVFLTTFDHAGFRLEIEYPKLLTDLESYSIKCDEDYKLIIVSLHNETPEASSEEIHIGVPMQRSVHSLHIGSPLENGGKIVISTAK